MKEMVVCEKCRESYSIGDYPFCPHGSVERAGLFIHTFRPYEDEHILGGPRPTEITSAGHRRALMKEHNLEIHAAGAGMPGCEV